jgi:hypothetical protein
MIQFKFVQHKRKGACAPTTERRERACGRGWHLTTPWLHTGATLHHHGLLIRPLILMVSVYGLKCVLRWPTLDAQGQTWLARKHKRKQPTTSRKHQNRMDGG